MEYTVTVKLNKNDVIEVLTEDGRLVGVVTESEVDYVKVFIEDYNRTITYTRADIHLLNPIHNA